MAHSSKGGASHSIPAEEKQAFVDYVNSMLAGDEHVAHLLPVSADGDELFQKCSDGLILIKLINLAVADTIDTRVVNKARKGEVGVFQKVENNNLVITSAKAIGCRGVYTGAQDLIDGVPHLVMGIMWQIIRLGLVSKIDLKHHPELWRLQNEGEEVADLLKLPPEEVLLRWVNFHLKNAGWEGRVKNFAGDIKDSRNYTVLLSQLADKQCTRDPLDEADDTKRAELMLEEAAKLDCRKFVTAADVVAGNPKLNLAFVANLFNTHPSLEQLTEEEVQEAAAAGLDDELFNGEGSREARAFALWLNSLGIEPFVENLFTDVRDGLVLLRALEKIGGEVDWKEEVNVPKRRPLNKFKMCENLVYAVKIAKEQLGFSLVSIAGDDIYEGKQKEILALVWQMMRHHVVRVLTAINKGGKKGVKDADIVQWANDTVAGAGKSSSIKDFKDPSLRSGVFVLDLLTAVKPEIVDQELVTDGVSDENALLNAKYAISIARKLGCTIFCLPEDIVDVKHKMILTFVGSVMAYHMNGGAASS